MGGGGGEGEEKRVITQSEHNRQQQHGIIELAVNELLLGVCNNGRYYNGDISSISL